MQPPAPVIVRDWNPFDGSQRSDVKFGFVPALNPMAGFNHDGYFTYPANRTIHMIFNKKEIPIHIRANGSRGMYDFVSPKPSGVYWIATLGGSSVLGYHARDDKTWPYHLEETLNRTLDGVRVEVLNLAFRPLAARVYGLLHSTNSRY